MTSREISAPVAALLLLLLVLLVFDARLWSWLCVAVCNAQTRRIQYVRQYAKSRGSRVHKSESPVTAMLQLIVVVSAYT